MKQLIEEREGLYWMGEAEDCMAKYMDGKHFKGEKGQRFDTCVKAMKECNSKVHSPEGLCAKIARGKK